MERTTEAEENASQQRRRGRRTGKNIHQVIVEVAPHASRIGLRVVLNALGNDGVARTALRLGAYRISRPDCRQGGYCRITGGGFYFCASLQLRVAFVLR
jgi:hypothetical protein